MTAQIGDKYTFKDKGYSIVATSEPVSFNPKEYGLEVQHICTACWRGYWCEYEISESGIILKKLFVHTADDKYPDIDGVQVNVNREPIEYMGHRVYMDLSLNITYTGKILLGDKLLSKYRINLGHPSPWEYKELKEFVFENGSLTTINDYSEIAKEIRKLAEEKFLKIDGIDKFKKWDILEETAKVMLPIEYNFHRAVW